MKKLVTTISSFIFAFHVQSQNFNAAKVIERPADFEYLSEPDSLGNRLALKMPSVLATQSLPYPIIFIHGLESYSSTWNTYTNYMDAQYGTTYGGRIDICLNYDGSEYTANKNFATAVHDGSDLALFTYASNLTAADYYYLNFDVGYNGGFNPNGNGEEVYSNQSAIVKQGLAVGQAIYMVLQKTGRDKVILMGHSMGGLAAREYLQNPANWINPNVDHHVAKIVTTGTPHGGSTQPTGGIVFSGVYCQSEAFRDLRTSYSSSGSDGIYLFDGYELDAVVNNTFCSWSYNVNVNCNGTGNNSGEFVTGLNSKNIYANLDYACIIGQCTGCATTTTPGDGIVLASSANINTYYPSLTYNLFDYYQYAVFEMHTDLPGRSYENMQGLDEPNEFALAYGIKLNTSYMGFTTIQSSSCPYSKDFDHYRIHLNSVGNLNINISNLVSLQHEAKLFDLSGNLLGSSTGNAIGDVNFSVAIPNAGDYYLQVSAMPDASSWNYPYYFDLSFQSTTGIEELDESNVSIYPNPNDGIFELKIENQSSNLLHISILNTLGQSIYENDYNQSVNKIDLGKQENGIYFLKMTNRYNSVIKKIVIQK
jgi:pimeloyl-ACP methyl ester carboxylesterase